MKLRSVLAKWPALRSPWIKYGALALALGLWTYGLVDQIGSPTAMLKYLAISLLMVAIAFLVSPAAGQARRDTR
jgi:hypothetical protein